jgi:hypothetical protein
MDLLPSAVVAAAAAAAGSEHHPPPGVVVSTSKLMPDEGAVTVAARRGLQCKEIVHLAPRAGHELAYANMQGHAVLATSTMSGGREMNRYQSLTLCLQPSNTAVMVSLLLHACCSTGHLQTTIPPPSRNPCKISPVAQRQRFVTHLLPTLLVLHDACNCIMPTWNFHPPPPPFVTPWALPVRCSIGPNHAKLQHPPCGHGLSHACPATYVDAAAWCRVMYFAWGPIPNSTKL